MPDAKLESRANLSIGIVLLLSVFSSPEAALAQNYIPGPAALVDLNAGMVCAIGSSKYSSTAVPPLVPYYLAKNGQGLGVWLPVTSATPSVSALQVGSDITSIQTSPSDQPYINSAAIRFFIIDNPSGINCSDITFTFTNTSTGDLAVSFYPYPQALFEMTAWESGGANVLTIDTSNVDSFEAPLMLTVSNGATTLAKIGNPVTSPDAARTTMITGPNDLGGQESPFVTLLQGQPGYANGPELFQNLALSSAPASPEPYPYARLESPKDYLTASCVHTNSGFIPSSCSLNNSLLHWSSPLNTFFDAALTSFFQSAYANPSKPLIVMGDASAPIAESAWTVTSNTANCPVYQVADGKSLQLTLNSSTIIICNPVGQVVPMAGSPIASNQQGAQIQVTQQQYAAAQGYVGWNLGQPETGFVGTITGVSSANGQYFIMLDVLIGSPNLSYHAWAFTNIEYGHNLNIFETSSEMVFANDGAFSSWAPQYISDASLQTVALSIQRNIVAAFSRGVANCNNVTMAGGQPPSFCASAAKSPNINPDAANASDAYWSNEANWFAANAVQDFYAAYIHTSRLDSAGNIVATTACPPTGCSNIFLVPNNSIPNGIADSNQGIPMGMGYAFGYDENPVYLSQTSQVPSKLDPIPSSFGTGLSLIVTIGRSQPNKATHDFNGDGKSDILWRDTAGDLALWLMNGGTVASSGGLGNLSATAWSVVGQRDFNGDGEADMLWRNTGGGMALWFMSGLQVASAASLGNVPAVWTIYGTGDLNGDGMGDLLWRDTGGDVAIWLMNGSTVSSAVSLGNVTTSWSIAGDDNTGNIYWQDTAGDRSIWHVSGGQVTAAASLGNLPSNWQIAGLGDFNGDGVVDILWRDSVSGTAVIWFMTTSLTVGSAASLGALPTNTWSIAQTGDYNGDGMSDIIWLSASGDIVIWFMNGGTVASSASLGNIGTAWTVQSTNAE
jgi:hypothetical protein